MNRAKRRSVALALLVSLLAAAGFPAAAHGSTTPYGYPYLHAPAVDAYARHDPAGTTILPNGRYIRPEGKSTPLARFPYGLAMSRDGKQLFVPSDGVGQLLTDWQSGKPQMALLNPPRPEGKGHERLNTGGADFSPDGKLLYWSGGESGDLLVFDTASSQVLAKIPLNVAVDGKTFEDSYAVDVKISDDGRYVYCADVTNFRLIVIDTAERRVVGSAPVGRYPYALAVSGSRVYAANIGLFEYSAIPAPTGGTSDPRGLTMPAFAYPSKEARDGVEFEGRKIPGLGDDNGPLSYSVTGVDVSTPQAPRVLSHWKTGLLVHAPSDNGKTIGGSAPNFLAVSGDSLYVADGNNDMIERIGMSNGKMLARRVIVPSPLVAHVRGVGPAGMTVSPDGAKLYVAESGINAIAVLDAHTLAVRGHIPTAWYPYRVAVAPDGRHLATISFKGFGNGPNGGATAATDNFRDMRGVISIFDDPSDEALREMSRRVLAYNGIVNRAADRAAMSSPIIPSIPGNVSKEIKYVVFITKENHTFDTIFDRIPGSRNDPSLLRWGLHQTISEKGQPTLEDVGVMVNHNALARAFTVSDNFYMEPEYSGVGHRWLMGVEPDNLMQMTYSVGWGFKNDSTAPGRRYSMESNGSLLPEDYPEAGSMWDQLGRHDISFRNYGEGFEFPGVAEDENESPTGARETVNVPMPKVLYDNTDFGFPIFNMNIPDQYRAHWFMNDIEQRYLRAKKPLPSFLNITLSNDHGTSPHPAKGYPYVASWMADNDLALGRVVEFLSHTPYWKHMAIFVTEDDSGGEPDHIDAQRSVMQIISPWVKRGYVSHRHTTILSMHRTLYEIFGLGPLNMWDALANDFSDSFTTKPDFRPYTVVPVDKRIFNPEKAKDPKDPDYGQARKMPSVIMDDDDEIENVLKKGAKEASKPR
jgi:YVTN family beta-propeller protein